MNRETNQALNPLTYTSLYKILSLPTEYGDILGKKCLSSEEKTKNCQEHETEEKEQFTYYKDAYPVFFS